MYDSFKQLIKCRGLNCRLDLGGLKLTQQQLDDLKEYINSVETYRLLYLPEDIIVYRLTIVENMEESDLKII